MACGLEAGHSFVEAFTIEWRNSSCELCRRFLGMEEKSGFEQS